MKSAAIIFRSLSLSRAKTESDLADRGGAGKGGDSGGGGTGSTPAGADDFLPLFIWVVLRAQVPRLFSNCEYVYAYLSPARLMGKSGYCLINLRSAIEFVMYIEADSINIDPQIFADKLAAAEAEQAKIEEQQHQYQQQQDRQLHHQHRSARNR